MFREEAQLGLCSNPTQRVLHEESDLLRKRGQTTRSYPGSGLTAQKKPNDFNGTSTRAYLLAILPEQRLWGLVRQSQDVACGAGGGCGRKGRADHKRPCRSEIPQ